MILPAIGLAVAALTNPCATLATPALIDQLKQEFPNYRWPRADESDEAAIKYSKGHGGATCLRVAAGDFDGDGAEDRAVLLSPFQSKSPVLLIAALRRRSGWQLAVLQRFHDTPRSFVVTGPPGTYEFFEPSATRTREDGEVLKLNATTAVIVTGTWEASEIVYGWKEGKWMHVWTSN